MAETVVAFRCPYCKQAFEAQPPDNWHFASTFDEPLMDPSKGQVKEQKIVCLNKQCQKTIKLYWYAPIEYFNTM